MVHPDETNHLRQLKELIAWCLADRKLSSQ